MIFNVDLCILVWILSVTGMQRYTCEILCIPFGQKTLNILSTSKSLHYQCTKLPCQSPVVFSLKKSDFFLALKWDIYLTHSYSVSFSLSPCYPIPREPISGVLSARVVGTFAILDRNRHLSPKQYETGPWLLWNDSSKLWVADRFVWFRWPWVTLIGVTRGSLFGRISLTLAPFDLEQQIRQGNTRERGIFLGCKPRTHHKAPALPSFWASLLHSLTQNDHIWRGNTWR